jgi:hypothetical protein
MKLPRTKALTTLTIAVGLGLAALSANAEKLQIQFLDFDFYYDGSAITDGTSPLGGVGNPAQSDALSVMEFYVDGTLVGKLENDIYLDMYIGGVSGISDTLPSVIASTGNTGNFGFDLLMKNSTPGFGLALNIRSMDIVYNPEGALDFVLVGGIAAGDPRVRAQVLPGFLSGFIDPNEDITITFSSTNVKATSAGGYITSFVAKGDGNVTGTYVPEPSEYLIGIAGVLALAYFGSRRRLAVA